MNAQDKKRIGVLGGGQLGRMLSMESRRMGSEITQWTGGENSGAANMASDVLLNAFDDQAGLEAFLQASDVATVEFENIPTQLLESIAEHIPTYPDAKAVGICQNRDHEKTFFKSHGIPTTPFRVATTEAELAAAFEAIPGDVIIKTLQFGYDGKGQLSVSQDEKTEVKKIWAEFQGARVIVEKRIQLQGELSVMIARGADGECITYDPAENIHKDHILDLSIVPARFSPEILAQAQEIGKKIATALEYVGVLGVEFFIDENQSILVNEMACRPHNSGHHTLDACETSQFEQQARVVNHQPLGSPALLKPVVMWNLLGDLWPSSSQEPDWTPVLSTPGATLHLYGKTSAKKKRKMGHVTFVADSVEEALSKAEHCRQAMNWSA